MKLRLLIRIAIIVSIVLLCTGFGVYSYLRLNAVENQSDFDLYSLVPPETVAVLETDRMAELVEDINRLDCSRDGYFLHVSELFNYLKEYLYKLVDKTPHGLSKQMNKMLISFHEPDSPLNQVLYCKLGSGDYEFLDSFVQNHTASLFPLKIFKYKGEDIRIYTLQDGRFLTVYFNSDFLLLAFKKRLIERVIDVYRTHKSLKEHASFRSVQRNKNENATATVFLRLKQVNMGKFSDSICSQKSLGSWAEFDLQFNENAIYCSGISHVSDSVFSFINTLQKQKPVDGFPGTELPLSTFSFTRWSMSDKLAVSRYIARQDSSTVHVDKTADFEMKWNDFLRDFAGESALSCFFLSEDTLDLMPCFVVSIPVVNLPDAERRIRDLINVRSESDGVYRSSSSGWYHSHSGSYKKYRLSRSALFGQMTGITEFSVTYGCFYKGNLILSSDERSIQAYIYAIEKGNLLDGESFYEEGIGSLATTYNFLMMTDMEIMLRQNEKYLRLVPNFFIQHTDFFRHFVLSAQVTCTDDAVYPNIVLLYKNKESK